MRVRLLVMLVVLSGFFVWSPVLSHAGSVEDLDALPGTTLRAPATTPLRIASRSLLATPSDAVAIRRQAMLDATAGTVPGAVTTGRLPVLHIAAMEKRTEFPSCDTDRGRELVAESAAPARVQLVLQSLAADRSPQVP